jgi:phosphoribosylformimino-5-aminoimidazole carboxamide ribotide isomerase
VPAIDLRGDGVVRLRQGNFAAETRYRVAPDRLLRHYAAAGARRVHVVNLDGAETGGFGDESRIRALAALEPGVRIQVGGGVRRFSDVSRLLDAGVDRVVVGSVAIRDPARFADWIARFGASRLVAALDVRIDRQGVPRLATHGWQRAARQSLWDLLPVLLRAGLRHALCTDIGRDGTMTGPNLALYRACVVRAQSIAWQASGGVRHGADLRALAATEVDVAISGRALLEKRIPNAELSPYLPAA